MIVFPAEVCLALVLSRSTRPGHRSGESGTCGTRRATLYPAVSSDQPNDLQGAWYCRRAGCQRNHP
jgi:hypothetical protein